MAGKEENEYVIVHREGPDLYPDAEKRTSCLKGSDVLFDDSGRQGEKTEAGPCLPLSPLYFS